MKVTQITFFVVLSLASTAYAEEPQKAEDHEINTKFSTKAIYDGENGGGTIGLKLDYGEVPFLVEAEAGLLGKTPIGECKIGAQGELNKHIEVGVKLISVEGTPLVVKVTGLGSPLHLAIKHSTGSITAGGGLGFIYDRENNHTLSSANLSASIRQAIGNWIEIGASAERGLLFGNDIGDEKNDDLYEQYKGRLVIKLPKGCAISYEAVSEHVKYKDLERTVFSDEWFRRNAKKITHSVSAAVAF
jgi:hypothetical protein